MRAMELLGDPELGNVKVRFEVLLSELAEAKNARTKIFVSAGLEDLLDRNSRLLL